MKLNVILITYNHSKFIEESLRSILAQKTNFDFNILVADDKSTDDTLERIKKYETRTNIPFCYLKNERNLGITKNYQRAFGECDAEYIAVMEGDDIWTDPYRLQKHINFLDHHYECTMSFNRYVVGDFNKAKYIVQPAWENGKGYQLITSRDIICENFIGNFSTCVYRRSAINALPESLFEMTAYDWIINIMVGRSGMIGYLTDVMSIYRIHTEGVWSSKREEDNIRETLDCIEKYNEFTNHLFENEFEEHRSRLKERLFTSKPLQIVHSSKFTRIKIGLKRIKDYTPPILIYIVKLIIPIKILNKIKGL
ncbi:putative glycosyltransferase EpsE [Desulfosporosinus acididurans]|uniref:Putative glycosyltransferase EpsE n=1 Tax=Desulfosporosinus acididurans TaxID=476652 RepID=A0A0J1FLG1_9FIRM|nr:glycosyltransferase [Desulfosporosinus acididurans]KLU64359.1 putative glycosyltransferase EpsE [Desulfosporosinus acididurans]